MSLDIHNVSVRDNFHADGNSSSAINKHLLFATSSLKIPVDRDGLLQDSWKTVDVLLAILNRALAGAELILFTSWQL
jgi:hypothetical protein